MKIAIRGGHNFQAQGASGVVNEVAEDRRIYPRVIEFLKMDGNDVLDVTPSNCDSSTDLAFGVNKANQWEADYFASIHLNAGGGQGCEVLYLSAKGSEYAGRISSKIASLGFTNRGAKSDTRGLYELKNTSMVANIIECFFCDSQSDINLYNSVGVDAIAKVIAEGIVGHEINSGNPQPQPVPQPAPQPQPAPPQADAEVLKIQKLMNQMKIANLAEDGIMGEKTKGAIMKFQEITHTDVDGIVGQNTWFRINEIMSRPFLSISNVTNKFAIMYLQWRVGTTNDGVFGQMTVNAVRKWQKENGLVGDALVGFNTWNKLLG